MRFVHTKGHIQPSMDPHNPDKKSCMVHQVLWCECNFVHIEQTKQNFKPSFYAIFAGYNLKLSYSIVFLCTFKFYRSKILCNIIIKTYYADLITIKFFSLVIHVSFCCFHSEASFLSKFLFLMKPGVNS